MNTKNLNVKLEAFTRNSTQYTHTCARVCVLCDKNVNVFTVTLLLVLLTLLFTWDSFLSLCQSPTPPHFCTDDVKQSAEDG